MTVPQLLDQEIVEVKLADLKPHPENPRVGDIAAIVASMERSGFYGVFIVQRSTMFVLAGAHRLQAMIERGEKKGLACILDVDDQTAREILLGDNRTHDLGAYDDAALAASLAKIEDLTGTGFDTVDVAAMLAATGQSSPLPPTPPPPVPQGLRPIVLPFEIGVYERLTGLLPDLRAEWDVDTNAELFLAVIRSAAEELEAEAAAADAG